MYPSLNKPRYVLSTLLVAVFMMAYGWFVHGHLLTADYALTPQLWRSDAEMQSLFPLPMLHTLALSAVIAYLFAWNYEGRGVGEGIRFGVVIGTFMGIMLAGQYLWLPVGITLAVKWFLTEFISGLGAAVLLSLTYKK